MVDARASNQRWRTSALALAVLALIASIFVVATGPGTRAGAQGAQDPADLTCWSIADRGATAEENPDGQADSLLQVDVPFAEPQVALAGGNGGLGAAEVTAVAVQADPSAPEQYTLWAWSPQQGLVTIDPAGEAPAGADGAAAPALTPAGVIVPTVDGATVGALTVQNDHDADATNDVLWVLYSPDPAEAPFNQLVAHAMDNSTSADPTIGNMIAGPVTITFGSDDRLTDITWDAATGVLYGLVTSSADADAAAVTTLISIDPATGAGTGIGVTEFGLVGLASTPRGRLVGVTGADVHPDPDVDASANDVHVLDKSTGATRTVADVDAQLGAAGLRSLDCVDPRPLAPNPGIVSAEIIDECVAGKGRVSASLTWTGGEAPVDWTASLTGRPDVTGTLSSTNTDDLAVFDNMGDGSAQAVVTNTATGVVLAARTVTVSCGADQPASVDVAVTTQCAAGDGIVTVTLTYATGAETVDWNVQIGNATSPGTLDRDTPIARVSSDALADGSHDVRVTVPSTGDVLAAETVIVNCDQTQTPGASELAASILPTCVNEDGRISVTVTLVSGDAEQTWTAEIAATTETGAVSPAQPAATVSSGALADGEHEVSVTTAAGTVVSQETITVECDQDSTEELAAQIIDECVGNQGRVQALISYVSGDDPVRWSVTSNGTLAQSGTLSPDTTSAAVILNSLVDDQVHTIVVSDTTSAQPVVLAAKDVQFTCAPQSQPGVVSAVVTSTCGAAGGDLAVSLSYVQGTESVDWKVVMSNGFTRIGTLSTAVPSSLVSAPGLQDGPYTVTVTNDATDEVLATAEQSVECAQSIPAELGATAAVDCATDAAGARVGEIVVTVAHLSGTEAGEYRISVSGAQPMSGSVLVGQRVSSVVTGLGESAYTVVVSDTASERIVSNEILNVACLGRQAATFAGTITSQCVNSLGEVTFEATYADGTEDAIFTILLGGQTVDTTTLTEAGSITPVVVDQLADGSYAAEIRVNGTAIETQTVDISCAGASIAVDMVTNGSQAASEPGVQVEVGAQVTWTYTITNDGTVSLSGIALADSEQGTIACPQTTLAVDQMMTCNATGSAAEGQYAATATVTAQVTGQSPVSASDTSYYFATPSALKVEKKTNGFAADTAPGPSVTVGDPITWTFRISNDGSVDFPTVTLSDNRIDAADITCPGTSLAAGQEMVCEATGTAEAGQHSNTATVIGEPATGANVMATNSSHYFGEAISVTIEKKVNGNDADTTTNQPLLTVGADVTYTWVVVNTGNADLSNVAVTDTEEGAVPCPATTVAAGATMECTLTRAAKSGQQTSTATVTATSPGGDTATDDDVANYLGTGAAISVEKFTNGQPGTVTVAAGSTVEWTYRITNTGDIALGSVVLTDSVEGVITCSSATLGVGGAMTCSQSGIAIEGSYTNTATVTAQGAGTNVSDTATASYVGVTRGVGDRVFTDLNENCMFDTGEPGVGDVGVELWIDANGDGVPDDTSPIATTSTDSSGAYLFGGVSDNTYVVKFDVPGNPFTCSSGNVGGSRPDPATGLTGSFIVAASGADLTVDAGLKPAKIGDKVFEDADADGIQDSGEEGVVNLTVKLWTDDDGDGTPDTEVDSTTTDSDGIYAFLGVDPALSHIVQFVGGGRVFAPQDAGSNDSNDSDANADGITAAITVDYGQEVADVDAGFVAGSGSSIGDTVFLDADEDCVADSGEGLEDVEIRLQNSFGSQIATRDSDASGKYLFGGLAAGDYKIVIDDSNTKYLLVCTIDSETLPGNPDAEATVTYTLDADEDELRVDWGFVECATIGDRVWADQDDDGIQDSGEPGVGNVVIKLYEQTSSSGSGTLVDQVTSAFDGSYEFSCVDPRKTYKVAVEGVNLAKANQGNDETVDSDIDENSGFSSVFAVSQGDDEVRLDIGVSPPDPDVDIEKLTNNVQSDLSSQARDIKVGDTVTWTYRVKNTGGIVLEDIVVTDDEEGSICTIATLDPGDTEDCTETGTATAGLYSNVGKVVASPQSGGMMVSDEDKSHYNGIGADSTTTATPTPTSTGTITPTATGTAVQNNNDLAVTGTNSSELALVAFGAIALGLGMVILARRRPDELTV